jgi:autotransporter-associated beta strand protein
MGGNNTGYSGNVFINGGVVNLGDSANGLGTGNNILLNGGVLETRWSTGITRSQGSGSGQIQITGGVSGLSGGGSGTGSATHNIGAIIWGSATFNPAEFVLQSFNSGAGTTTLSSAMNLNSDDPAATVDGSGIVWRTIRSDQGNIAGTGTFSGNITNSGTINQAGLIKTGVGQHILSGTNTYDGGTQVNQGILTATAIGALPGWNTSGKITVADGAMLAVRTGAWTRPTLTRCETT